MYGCILKIFERLLFDSAFLVQLRAQARVPGPACISFTWTYGQKYLLYMYLQRLKANLRFKRTIHASQATRGRSHAR